MNPRILAVTFTALMLVSSFPPAQSSHVDPAVPDVPVLPRVHPTQNCMPIGLDAEILARVNQAMAGDPAFYQDDLGVPTLCVNGPSEDWKRLINDADAILEHVRKVSNEIQRQLNWRLEGTLPQSNYPNDLVEPRTTLLNDSFDGYRQGGFGDWGVVTEKGEDPAWAIERLDEINGTRYAYRFGGPDGYAQGVHQFLVSPELDLTALKGNQTAVRDLAYLREQARDRLRFICANPQANGMAPTPAICGESGGLTGQPFPTPAGPVSGPALHAVVVAYEAAFDAHLASLPVMQHGAFLDLTYKLNMAPGEDGVRMWIYNGDRAPDRRTFFNESFGDNAAWRACVYENVPGSPVQIRDVAPGQGVPPGLIGMDAYELSCPPEQEGGVAILPSMIHPTEPDQKLGMMEVSSLEPYKDAPSFPQALARTGFSGDVPEWTTARLNLSDWMGERVWIVFEVATKRNDRGEDIFNDTSRFPRKADYGFQLGRVNAEGDAYHRNFRVKATAATYGYQIPSNDFDDPTTTRTTTPPGDKPIVTWVHNAGDYIENGTLTVTARVRAEGTSSFTPLGSHKVNVSLRPDEVKSVSVPWGLVLTTAHPTLKEDHLYEVTASLAESVNGTGSIPDQTQNLGNNTPPIADPNATRVRPANAAGIPGLDAGSLSNVSHVRAATIRDVTLLRADRQPGNPLQLCRSVDDDNVCVEHYAAPKGEPRVVLVGVRNDGNTAQNISLDLTPSLDGVGKPDIVLDGVRKTARDVLPGEVRAITWNLIATQPGAYDLTITPIPEVPAGVAPPTVKNAERKLFVQRSTGLVCLDTIEERECGPAFVGELQPKLRNENITAAATAADGTLFVATTILEADDTFHSGQLAARDPMGTWHVLANLSGTVLNQSFAAGPREGFGWGSIRSIVPAPDGNVYLVGDNDTVLRYSAAAETPLSAIPSNTTLPTNLTAATWYKGTLLAAGANGVMARLANGVLEPFTVSNQSYQTNAQGQPVVVMQTYDGNFTSLVVAPNGAAVVAGQNGTLLRHDPTKPVTEGWTEARMIGTPARTLSDALSNTTILTLGVHDGHVLAGGPGFLLASTLNSTTGWAPLLMPPAVPEFAPRIIRSIVETYEGHLYVLQGDDIASCANCYPRAIDARVAADAPFPTWEFVTPARPSVDGKGPLHPARPLMLLAGEATSLLLGEAGMVLDLVNEGSYDNLLGWTVVPKLAPRDGGVLQTKRGVSVQSTAELTSNPQSILLVPDEAGRAAAQSATRFRFFLNHSMNWTEDGSGPRGITMRLVYRNYPDTSYGSETTGRVYTCSPTGPTALALNATCNLDLVREEIARFTNESTTDGWEFFTREMINAAGPTAHPAPGSDSVGLWFWALEIVNTDKIRYAIDDVRLQGLVGNAWTDVVSWYGPQRAGRGDWYVEDVYNAVFKQLGEPDPIEIPEACTPQYQGVGLNICLSQFAGNLVGSSTHDLLKGAPAGLGTTANQYQWEAWPRAPFDLAVESPWHVSMDYADRPVFAANNEQYKPGWSSPSGPRLMSDWDARLVSPVIDLTDAYDPVIAWNHLYSFRTFVIRDDENEANNKVQPADGGFVEVQYTMTGEECGSEDPETVCWSPFYPVEVDNGYPNKDQVGFSDVPAGNYWHFGRSGTPPNWEAFPPVKGRIGTGLSYWGSIAEPDATGQITDTRFTDRYVPAKITLEKGKGLCDAGELKTLKEQINRRIDCLPHNVTGRQIRVAFHLMTAGTWEHNATHTNFTPEDTYNHTLSRTQLSFPGEGWYITDFRVLGAEQLGIDLRATNMTFAVGYDFATIGVGPGTRVPVNVTIENRGVFDALGYTGTLEVRRVLDRATKTTEHVATILLSQQPVLDAGKSATHTLFWNVPETEGAEYALTFTVVPIGIDRDEDHIDNVARLGTTSAPILGQTMRRFHVEFLVSPENATSDITRYVPMFINNTGNTPLDSFTIERRITALGRSVPGDAQTCAEWLGRVASGLQSAIVDCREWTTQRPAPAGTLTPLTVLSDEVSPTNDLFWKAPERATFLVSLKGETMTGGTPIVSTAEKRVAAFATYLFDDVEGGVRGEARTGDWVYGPAWNATQPGFRSTDAYSFGDPALERFPADTESSLVSPTIDLGSARTARLAFYTDFAFEPGFDGAVLEASDDGGKSWSLLTPISDPLTSASYNTTEGLELQASSALHPTGNPEDDAYAFTSDSSRLPASVDGWVLSQTDLTRYANVTEPDVEYEAYHAAAMSRYTLPPFEPKVDNIYYSPDWCPGPAEDGRCWESQNLTQGIRAPTAAPGEMDNGFLWSGSGSVYDDHMRPVQNHLIEFPVEASQVAADEVVVADWWEYGSRYNSKSVFLDTSDESTASILTAPGVYTVHTFHPGSVGADNYRFNLGEPKIVETRGKWYHMQADLTDIVKRAPGGTFTVGFAYTPVKDYSQLIDCTTVDAPCTFTGTIDAMSNSTASTEKTEYFGRDQEDRGFAIDGFKIESYRITRGAPGPRTPLVTEEAIIEKLTEGSGGLVFECGIGTVGDDQGTPLPSWSNNPSTSSIGCADHNTRIIRRAPITTEPGRNWAVVTEIPGVDGAWRTVKVTDFAGKSETDKLPTGDVPHAWYTGDIGCRDLPPTAANFQEAHCARPQTEARLVTPAFDLARIAGDNAQLSFWHRYAFHQRNVSSTPLASGGVVEISEFDAQTGEWGAWKQIYSSGDFRVDDPNDGFTATTPIATGIRGGYTGFTANYSTTNEGPRRFDPPFENVIPDDRDTPVQFLYTGNSASIEAHLPDHLREGRSDVDDGWLREEFDVTDYLGSKVRFGFHYAYSPNLISSQQNVQIDGRSGWWISDVAVVGDVLVGKPVQLRVRAATDGNVQDGHFAIDDIGVFGARYRNNVGIFVDNAPDKYGAYASSSTTIPVTLRNLGDTVRRDLALEVRIADGPGLTVTGSGPGGNQTVDGAFVLKGFTLGPGQSAVANVTVHTSKTVNGKNATIVLQLREANPQSTLRPFGAITDNEVQGLLTRYVPFRMQLKGEFEWDTSLSGIRQVTPAIGDAVEFALAARNPGHGPVTLVPTCVAETILEYVDVNHDAVGGTETPVVGATYPCEITGPTTLGAKQSTTYTFRATPTKAGFLRFAIEVDLIEGTNATTFEVPKAGVPVGVPLVTYRETFDSPEAVGRFSGTVPGFEWSHTRGHRQTGSLVVGINESDALDGTNYATACGGGACVATTPPIDLHNYSATTPAFLSFYHLDRLARHDGAQVRVQALQDEMRPSNEQSWSKECMLRPDDGYDGIIRQKPVVTPSDPFAQTEPADPNPVFAPGSPYNPNNLTTDEDFFTTSGGVWEESWTLAVFSLGESCLSMDKSETVEILGRTVRFSFHMFPGNPGMVLRRGPGHGFLVDEISVGPLALDVRPLAGQRAALVDNTTKGFNVKLTNDGAMPDIVTLEYDALNSSAPAGSVSVPTERYVLMPGESRTVTVHVTLPRDPSLLPTEFRARILAHSILDPNAAGATRIDLAFGPREWAELAVSVEVPKGIVQEATETFIPVTIENTGLVDSVPSRLRIVDEWAGGRVEHSLDLGSMPSYAQSADEALRVLEFRWRPERGSIGPHTLTFEVDPEVRGEEYTRTNNLVQIVVPVSDLLIPDLHIANFSALTLRNAIGGTVSPGLDADVARYEVTAGEVVSFELKVANKGRAGATNVEVRAFIGPLSLPPKTIPYIAPGTEAVVTFNWLAQKGEHEIEFIVRNEQVELTPTNNRYPGTGVTLLTVKGYEVVVEIPALDEILSPASERMVPFRITNNGNAGEDLELRATTPAGMRIMLPREGFFLRAGETYEDEARLILAAEAVAGQQFISIDAIARENPMKVATGRAAVDVLASYGGSIAGGFATGAPPELVIPVELVNEGNSLEPWEVSLTLPAGWSVKGEQPARVVVPAHDRVTHQFHVTLPMGTAPGDRVVAVKAEMANGDTREGVARVGVTALRSASVVVSDAAPTPQKGELSVPIRVQNTGNVREPFSLLLVDPPAGVEMRVEPAEFLLAPGAVGEATLIVKPNATVDAGTYAVVGYTRFEGVVPQTREGLANMQTLRVPIARQDLRVTSLEFSPRADLDAGDRVTVRASVQNFGQSEVTNVPVHLFVDDVFVAETIVPRILAGARVDVAFNWTALDGVHTLTAVADPYEDTVDAGREDNAVSALATVGSAATNGGVAAGRADAPMGGAWIVLAALAIGMLVTRTFGSWRRERR